MDKRKLPRRGQENTKNPSDREKEEVEVNNQRLKQEAKRKGRRLTGYECARMERLVMPVVKIIGMKKYTYEKLKAHEANIEFPEAFSALMWYLCYYQEKVYIRQQCDLLLDFRHGSNPVNTFVGSVFSKKRVFEPYQKLSFFWWNFRLVSLSNL